MGSATGGPWQSHAVHTSCLRNVAVNTVTTAKIGFKRNHNCTSMSETANYAINALMQPESSKNQALDCDRCH